MLKKIFNKLKLTHDHRVTGRSKHSLACILMIVFIATAAGCHGWKATYSYACSHFSYFKQLMPELVTIPSVDTFARVIAAIDHTQLAKLLESVALVFLRRSKKRKPGRIKKNALPDTIALDGKTAKGAVKRGMTKSEVHIVNAVCNLLTLLVEPVKEKSNEITAFPLILSTLDRIGMLARKVITIDAMGCQRELAMSIINYGADYMFCLKGNQSGLLDEVKTLFNNLDNLGPEFGIQRYTSPHSKANGRIEYRTITSINLRSPAAASWVTKSSLWEGIANVMMVERFAEKVSVSTVKQSPDVRFFITSLSRPASQLLEISIQHWKVETMHSILDDTEAYAEDKCKIYRGNAPEILSFFRKLALNFVICLNKKPTDSVREILALFKRSFHYLYNVLTKKPDEVPPPIWWRDSIGRLDDASLGPILPL
jgi:predicted transposase YbfD/YdcC